MPNFPIPTQNNRIGFHYFPDTNHYREIDLITWLPILKNLRTNWITMEAPIDRAIPEYFLNGIQSSGIEPVLHIKPRADSNPCLQELLLIFEAYAKWGIHYLVLFDKPNWSNSWSVTAWAQPDIVERFLDRFIPIAESVLRVGLIPILAPLMPGSDYWDTAFLRAALQGLERRGNQSLIDHLVLGAYAFAGKRPLEWGYGGPERWPGSHPYHTPEGSEDQIGFRIFDWYTAISKAVLGKPLPMILFGLGSNQPDYDIEAQHNIERIIRQAQALAELSLPSKIQGFDDKNEAVEFSLPFEVLAGNFWLLSSEFEQSYGQAWFFPDGTPKPVVEAYHKWIEKVFPSPIPLSIKPASYFQNNHPISHYLLLPSFEWGITDWHLNAARPFIRKHLPVIGFSIEEALLASKVTVVGGIEQFPDSALDHLRAAGCVVERIDGDGTSIATQLSH